MERGRVRGNEKKYERVEMREELFDEMKRREEKTRVSKRFGMRSRGFREERGDDRIGEEMCKKRQSTLALVYAPKRLMFAPAICFLYGLDDYI
ncbi:hypothetical protein Tco_0880686 [Tanacetum coccineum]